MTRHSNIRTVLMLGCAIAAIVFFTLALRNPDTEPAGWTAVNESAAAALAELEEDEAAQSEAEPESGNSGSGAALPGSAGTDAAQETAGAGEAAAGNPAGDSGTQGGGTSGDHSAAGSLQQDGKLDINTASAGELDELKGIGPAKAAAIVADREANGPFRSTSDLLRVKGIGEKLLAGIEDSIVALP